METENSSAGNDDISNVIFKIDSAITKAQTLMPAAKDEFVKTALTNKIEVLKILKQKAQKGDYNSCNQIIKNVFAKIYQRIENIEQGKHPGYGVAGVVVDSEINDWEKEKKEYLRNN